MQQQAATPPAAPGLEGAPAAILSALTLNARATYSSLARELGMSRQMVKYHLDELEQRGVVEGYYAILNVVKLGHLFHRVLIRFAHISAEEEQSILAHLQRDRRVGWVAEYQGSWHAGLAVWTRTMYEFEEFLDDMTALAKEHIEDKLISYSTRIHHLKNKYLLGETNDASLTVGGEVDEISLDDLDYEILGILTKNGRASYAQTGATLGVDPKVVQYRIQRLIEAGVILGFNVKINHSLLGFTLHKVFLKLASLSRADLDSIVAHLMQRTNVVCITKSIGFSDLEFEVMAGSNEELHHTIRDLGYRFPDLVRDSWSLIVSRESYVNYLPERD